MNTTMSTRAGSTFVAIDRASGDPLVVRYTATDGSTVTALAVGDTRERILDIVETVFGPDMAYGKGMTPARYAPQPVVNINAVCRTVGVDYTYDGRYCRPTIKA